MNPDNEGPTIYDEDVGHHPLQHFTKNRCLHQTLATLPGMPLRVQRTTLLQFPEDFALVIQACASPNFTTLSVFNVFAITVQFDEVILKEEIASPDINPNTLNHDLPTHGLILRSLDLQFGVGYRASGLTTTRQTWRWRWGSWLCIGPWVGSWPCDISKLNRGGVIIWPTFVFSSTVVLFQLCIEILEIWITYASEGHEGTSGRHWTSF